MAHVIHIQANRFNPERLLDEGQKIWGKALMAVNAVQEGPEPRVGETDARPVVAAQFIFKEGAAVSQAEVQALVNDHDPAQPGKRQRRALADADLRQLGAEAVRNMTPEQLPEVVAALMEALGLAE